MNSDTILAFICYFSLPLLIGFFASRAAKKTQDFALGQRSINYWVTAISVQASDMSGWLFMGYPAIVFAHGCQKIWVALGLFTGMFLTWQLLAKKIRTETEKFNCRTLSSYFESRFEDKTGMVRISSAIFCLIFFTFYISSGLVEMGRLLEAITGIPYTIGVSLGVCVVLYSLFGGFVSMAWIDFFQGIFLLLMLMLVPYLAYMKVGGLEAIRETAHIKNIPLSFLPDSSLGTLRDILFSALEWGLGYFGMPHILTKFMGLNDVSKMKRAQYIGMSWQIIALISASCVGLVGIAFFKEGLPRNELIFIHMVKELFPPFFASLILCAVMAAAINVMGAQVLSSASIIAEDFYKKYFMKSAEAQLSGAKRLQNVSRACVLVICICAYASAFTTDKTIFSLVKYAWSGLGCTFGPVLLVALYTKVRHYSVALAGILVGGTVGALWPHDTFIPAMIAGYLASFFSMGTMQFLIKRA
ncbi:MAG: sodium/proline symporter [Oligoflexales bacterium]|nr:sodium/proline symporter [Oligoflexales bacterium]